MKKLSIINEEKEIKIKITNPINKKEFYMNIPLKEKSLKSEMDSIIPYIMSLNDKINDMEKRMNIFENKLNELYLIKEEYCKLKKKIDEENNRIFPESNIIKLEDENVILSWFDKKPLRFQLLMDTKKDGDLISVFYSKCGNISPTILFFKTTNGARFGGYTTQIWPSKGVQADENSFVFSLDKKEKYKNNNPRQAIWTSERCFQFGRCCFRIYDKCTSRNDNYINDGKNYYNIPENFGLTGGNNSFVISSYEVYKLEF